MKQKTLCPGTCSGGVVTPGNETTLTVIGLDYIQKQDQVQGDEDDEGDIDMEIGAGMRTSGGGMNMEFGSMILNKEKDKGGDGSSQVSDLHRR